MLGRRRNGRPAAVVAVGALALCVLLAGCGGRMPDSGPAGAGRDVGDVSSDPLRVVPEGPSPGAEPAMIVAGFLRAGAGFDDGHAVARSFLTASASAVWQPGQGTVVYPDDPSLTVTTEGKGDQREVTVTAPQWASIDATGQLVLAPRGTTASTSFTVVRTGGEWRIDDLSPSLGLWMPRYEFERAYTPLRLSFVATGTRVLVPDLRWFAGSRPALATAVVRALLEGPAPYLRGAVSSGAPAGTTLGVDAVPTAAGTATIDLSSSALAATPDERQQLWAQLTTSLRQLPTVSDISLTADGAAYPVAGLPANGSAGDLGFVDDVRVSGPVMVLSSGHLLQVDPASGVLSSSPSGRFSPDVDVAGLRAVAAGPETNVLVGVDQSGTRLYAIPPGAPRTVLFTGADLATPVVDRSGWAWSADRRASGEVVVSPSTSSAAAAAGTTATSTALRPAWLAGRRVQSLDVSRDGARLAVVSVGRDGATHLDVAGVVRDRSGRPTSLAPARRTAEALTQVRDVSWADRTNLAVLAGRVGAPQPYQVEVGGLVSALPPVQGAAAISAGDGLRAVYVVTTDGRVLVRTGNGWRALGRGTSVTIPQ